MNKKGRILVTSENDCLLVSFTDETNIKEVLDSSSIHILCGCTGNGACGLCKIIILSTENPTPTVTEQYHLSETELKHTVHLACQVAPRDGMHIQVVNTFQDSESSTIRQSEYYLKEPIVAALGVQLQSNLKKYGLTVDMGSTNISATLWDLYGCKRLSGRSIPNSQAKFGSDIMTRIVAANQSPKNASKLSELAIESIGKLIYDICSREGYNPFQISAVNIVGNTAELALLSGRNYDALLHPQNWAEEIDCSCQYTGSWVSKWCIQPDTAVSVVQPIAGFVGSDLLAGVLATDMTAKSENSLLLDFGTNTEIALWDGVNIWITSAAGGPAFEGGGLSSGISAGPDAIYKIDSDENSTGYTCHTIVAGRKPKGICGSGIVDLIALLLDAGIITYKGKFKDQHADIYDLKTGSDRFTLTERDIDLFMRSKAAIGTGVSILLKSAGLTMNDIGHVYISGIFGKNLNLENSIKLGLLPAVSPQIVELCGNTALAGCEMLMISEKSSRELELIRKKTKLINMANEAEFGEFYLNNLFLKPMEAI